jgi:glucose-6-phosphate dehydrogenase assembly protein OpcA
MPKNYKILGQVSPGATTDTTLYTVPSSTQAVISTISVANRAATQSTFRIAAQPAGATIANEHYIAYDVLVDANDTTTITMGITLAATDVITVRSSTTNLSFSAFGSEITA